MSLLEDNDRKIKEVLLKVNILEKELRKLEEIQLSTLIKQSGLKKNDVVALQLDDIDYRDMLIVGKFNLVEHPYLSLDMPLEGNVSHALSIEFMQVSKMMKPKIYSKRERIMINFHTYVKVGTYFPDLNKVVKGDI